ncbi:nuclear transport factor 2 family protein [Yinghuangia aomiensis]|uniref:Nuclear transport factor 2 family protein n=1 Tax=Yinghuangia aomiensis TaxID=676205 RepID=A0ABP9IDS4_9ACTN
MTDATLAFAKDFFDAVADGDIDSVRRYYRDDVKVWHNWDEVEQTKDENLATLASIPQRYDTFAYAEVRCTALPDGGFLRQHVIQASRGGRHARVPAVLRVYVEAEQVYRIEEYFDYGQLTSALAG